MVEIAGNGFYGSPKCAMNKFEPLIMDSNIKKHSNLLFHTCVDAILQKNPLSLNLLTSSKKRALLI
jgi:hypothetical protein